MLKFIRKGVNLIKTLLFDNNGVFTTNDLEGTYQNLAEFFGVDMEELKPNQDFIASDLDEGKITTDQFYDLMQQQLKTNKDNKEIRRVHLGSYKLKEEMKGYAKELKDRFELAMLTNFGDGFDEANREYWQLEELFDPKKIFVSCKLGMRKPNPDFYLYALNELKNKPEEVIFIDDKRENVEAAEKIGMKGIIFKNVDQVKEDLEKIIAVEKSSV